ncbi:MAG: hypothetical protein AAF721_13590 [Myxococcota bacterium]
MVLVLGPGCERRPVENSGAATTPVKAAAPSRAVTYIGKDSCTWPNADWYPAPDATDTDSEYLRGWVLVHQLGGSDGTMSVTAALAEAREKKWRAPAEVVTDDIAFAVAYRELTGKSAFELMAHVERCTGENPAAGFARAIDLKECTPSDENKVESAQSMRTRWYQCPGARLSVARIEGPPDFVSMLVDSYVENQKRLASERGGVKVAATSDATVTLEGAEHPATRLLFRGPKEPFAMLAASFVLDGRGYAVGCMTALGTEDIRCPAAFEQLVAFAKELPDLSATGD